MLSHTYSLHCFLFLSLSPFLFPAQMPNLTRKPKGLEPLRAVLVHFSKVAGSPQEYAVGILPKTKRVRAQYGELLTVTRKRHRGDSNPCGQSPMDFESISLTARTQCLWMQFDCSALSNATTWIVPRCSGSNVLGN